MFVVPARSVVHATPRTRILTLDLRGRAFTFAAGQAVLVGLANGSVRRPYSIASAPSRLREDESLELLVQIDGSAEDPHLECAVPGTLVSIEGPFGSFCLPAPVAESRVLFVAGGTGIAPLRSMLQEVLEGHPAIRPTLIYSARGPEEFAFLDEWTRLASEGRLDLYLTVTRSGVSDWSGSRGRIDDKVIASVVPAPDTRCFVCGPPAMVSDTVRWLRAAGVPDNRIQSEAE
jgi:2-polyprenylphenol hydroxylase and related flavodoxin oxidoreductases